MLKLKLLFKLILIYLIIKNFQFFLLKINKKNFIFKIANISNQYAY